MAVNIVEQADRWVRVSRVLISVSDKKGLDVLVSGLLSMNDELRILSTGGTHARIAELLGPAQSEKHLQRVSDYTGQPETQGGLVKTLDFKIYLGLLTETYNEEHRRDLQRTAAQPIDMVVVNLYPFVETVAAADVTVERARANIDIGGPCMLRAAAKNYLRVAALCDPGEYQGLMRKMRLNGGRIDLKTRFELAQKAFRHTADYDKAIAAYLAEKKAAQAEACYSLQDGE